MPTDVTDPAQVDGLFAAVKEKFGRVDMLFNNAGGGMPTTNFGDFTWEMWLRVVAVNLNAMFLCANAAFRMMRDQTRAAGASSTTARFRRMCRGRARWPILRPSTRSPG